MNVTAERMEAGGYPLTASFDEAFAPDGRPRRAYAGLIGSLGDLGGLRDAVTARLDRDGVRFGRSLFPLDPIPRLIPAEEWGPLAAGLGQRARALGEFIADAYGDRRIVAAGVMPKGVIETADHFEPWMIGVEIRPEAFVTGLDLVRGDDGELLVLEDNTRTPSGMVYAAFARAAVAEQLPCGDGVLDPDGAFELLGAALRAAAPGGDPSIVLLSDGPENAAWFEHQKIGRRLGIPVVQPGDVAIRGGRLRARLADGRTRDVDVVYRRTDVDGLRDHAGLATWVAELLLAPVRRGTLAVVNPFGAGLADDKLVHAYVEEMVRFYLGEEPLLRSVRTLDLADDDARAEVLGSLEDFVVKPRGGYGGAGVVVGRQSSEDALRSLAGDIAAAPREFIAQETVNLCTHPTVCDGRLEPRHVDLRPFVFGTGEVAPVALTRVAFEAGEMIVNSSRGGGAKDTWLAA